jgi:hypothetical protein
MLRATRAWTIAHEADLLHHPSHQDFPTHSFPWMKRILIKHPDYLAHAFSLMARRYTPHSLMGSFSISLRPLSIAPKLALSATVSHISSVTFEIRNFQHGVQWNRNLSDPWPGSKLKQVPTGPVDPKQPRWNDRSQDTLNQCLFANCRH